MDKLIFIIVGVGGIGGAVARDLPKLISGTHHKMILIDGDIVEEKNTFRQPYQSQDIGINKARALAKKINSFYDVKCLFEDKYITNEELETLVSKYKEYTPVFVGCVDNDSTRQLIEKAYLTCETSFYIDGANSEYDGNIYFSKIENKIKNGPLRSEVYQLQDDINPGLVGCEDHLAKGSTQFFITNNKLASIMLQLLDAIIKETDENVLGVTIVERFNTIHY